jgi:hypothetical protein
LDAQVASGTTSEEVLVTAPTEVSLGAGIFEGPFGSDCNDSGGGYCPGTVDDVATIGSSFNYNYNSGQYQLGPGSYGSSGTGPNCGGFCSYFLTPGEYAFTVTIHDELDQQGGATALPFTEEFIGTLDWTTGNIVIAPPVPEPWSAPLLVAALAVGFIGRRFLLPTRDCPPQLTAVSLLATRTSPELE